jgi:hypothetical protein
VTQTLIGGSEAFSTTLGGSAALLWGHFSLSPAPAGVWRSPSDEHGVPSCYWDPRCAGVGVACRVEVSGASSRGECGALAADRGKRAGCVRVRPRGRTGALALPSQERQGGGWPSRFRSTMRLSRPERPSSRTPPPLLRWTAAMPEPAPVYTNRLQCVECGRVSRENERG